jgi:hypothetical protein
MKRPFSDTEPNEVSLDKGIIGKKLRTAKSLLGALGYEMHRLIIDIDVSTGLKDAKTWLGRVQNADMMLRQAENLAARDAGEEKSPKHTDFIRGIQQTGKRLALECNGFLKEPSAPTATAVKNKGLFAVHFAMAARDIYHLSEHAPKRKPRTRHAPRILN